jgi:hypothetical protein
MPFKERAQLVIVSVLISLALAAAAYLVIRPVNLSSDGDAPIIMAGGSFHIGTSYLFTFKTAMWPTSAPEPALLYWDGQTSARKVFQVDVIYFVNGVLTPTTIPITNPTTVDLKYCKTKNCNAAYDTVTIKWDGTDLWIVSKDDQNRNNTFAKLSRLTSNLRVHSNKNWYLSDVKVDGTQFICDNDGGKQETCQVVIHNCKVGSTCIPEN